MDYLLTVFNIAYEVHTFFIALVPSEVPLDQEDPGRIGMLVSRYISMEDRHTSELKTLNGIGVGTEAGGVYICIADNNRTTSSENITISIKGLSHTF